MGAPTFRERGSKLSALVGPRRPERRSGCNPCEGDVPVGLKDIPGSYNHIALYGDWLQQKSYDELWKLREKLRPDDIVFAQNDPMALGAYEVYRKLGMEKTAAFMG